MINNTGEVSKYKFSHLSQNGLQVKPEFNGDVFVLGTEENYSTPQQIVIIYNDEFTPAFNLFNQAMRLRDRCQKDGHIVRLETAAASLMTILGQGVSNVPTQRVSEDDSEIKRFFMDLLADALKDGVSDIHFEVRRERAIIRYRINGELVNIDELPANYVTQVAQVVYSVIAEATDVTFKPDQPQDGLIDQYVGVEQERLRVRLATVPAAPDGFDMVLRLLPIGKGDGQDQKHTPIQDLGYSEEQVKVINAGVAKPVGLTIFAGTTGSGKSTTLKSILEGRINSSHKTIKAITVEDPPEYFIPGATQIPVVRRKGVKEDENPFAAAIRAAMRSDPNILMVGEVRDKVSCDLLTAAVQSGHQVLSTVHASSAIGVVGRLANLGLRRDILGSPDFLGCLVYQKLLPTLCQHCSIHISDKQGMSDANIDDNMINRLQTIFGTKNLDNSKIRFRNHDGCEHCRLGVTGRAVAAEVILPDPIMLDFIYEGRDMDALRHWRKHGGQTALDHAISKIKDGLVSPGDVEAELGPLTSQMVMDDGVFDIKTEAGFAGPGSRSEVKDRENAGLSISLPKLDDDGFLASKDADEVDNGQ